ncbi:hypothetical protein PFICI_04639 [Pestalotiopsis fici W106-1]|uniref:Uncharacterized protein n=1 Tax=Pestalotiopsis fici (strain W106-1 / CGMCC3.15140) TaxID=1229662 RepID=W3X9I7_PESFW|nr:uncharacterized protein PFICI_04639 [Pestalotiopsis fici W106-1]ETS82763.1 hypothetical protein PFICI_04639 [Pestalotiopsis fici W106-1]
MSGSASASTNPGWGQGKSKNARKKRRQREKAAIKELRAPRKIRRNLNRALNEARRVNNVAKRALLEAQMQAQRVHDDARMAGHTTLNEEQMACQRAVDNAQRAHTEAMQEVRRVERQAHEANGHGPPRDAPIKLQNNHVGRHRATFSQPKKVEIIDLTQDDTSEQIQSAPGMFQPNTQPYSGLTHSLKQEPLAFDAAALQTMEQIGFNSESFRDLQQGLTPLIKLEQQTQYLPSKNDSSSLHRAGILSGAQATKPATTFGAPSKPLPGLQRVAWTTANPEAIANLGLIKNKSLEDLYQEYPEKRLRGIEPETLCVVANTVHQVAKEAANTWLKSACPGTRWNDSIVNVEGLYDFNASELDYTILDRSLCLQVVKKTVISQLGGLRAFIHDTKIMTPLNLLRVIDQSVAICQNVKDNKRRILLEKAKQKLEWLPVGLDCKKLDIHRRANQGLREAHTRVQGEEDLSLYSEHMKRFNEAHAETQVLDRALVEFQEHRLMYLIEIFRTLQQLLEASA